MPEEGADNKRFSEVDDDKLRARLLIKDSIKAVDYHLIHETYIPILYQLEKHIKILQCLSRAMTMFHIP